MDLLQTGMGGFGRVRRWAKTERRCSADDILRMLWSSFASGGIWLPGSGGDDGRAWAVGRRCHHLALGPVLCTDLESAASPRPPIRIAPGGWTKRMSGSPASGHTFIGSRFRWRHNRFRVVAQAGPDCSQALPALSVDPEPAACGRGWSMWTDTRHMLALSPNGSARAISAGAVVVGHHLI